MAENAKFQALGGTQRVYLEEAGHVVAVIEALANPKLRGAITTVRAGRSVDYAALGHALISHGLGVLLFAKFLTRDETVAVQEMIAELSGHEWEYEEEDAPDIPF